MSRGEASRILFLLSDSPILSDEIKEQLHEIGSAICSDSFDPCLGEDLGAYCVECRYNGERE